MNLHTVFICNASPEDKEKAVLPALIYVPAENEDDKRTYTVHLLTLGWWHWSVGIGIGIVKKKVQA